MSAANCPETPRQKMISMMYLFLTAMLAINVSDTVLNSFGQVDESLRKNNEILGNNNNNSYSDINTAFINNEIKFKDAHDKSLKIRAQVDTLDKLIEGYKWEIARLNDGEEGNPYNLVSKDNTDVGAQVMTFKFNPKKPSKAELLKGAINQYRDFLLNDVIVDTAQFSVLSQNIINSLNTEDPTRSELKEAHTHNEGNLTWEDEMFVNIPVAAIMPLMTKLQSDIKNTEAMALSFLLSQATAGDFKVNDIKAHLIPSTTYLIEGNTITGNAILAASDSTQPLKYNILLDGKKLSEEKGYFEIKNPSIGKHTIEGSISYKTSEGIYNPYSFESITFEVAKPSATVSATKMNVLYAGVENPMSISAPGFSAKEISPKFDDGSPLTPDGDGYMAKPKTPGKIINVLVYANVEGNLKLIGKSPFRVKSLPPPTAFIKYPKETQDATGKKVTLTENFPSDDGSNRFKKKDLLNAYGVVAELPGSDFKVEYDIESFDMTFYDNMGNAKTLSSNSSKFTNEQISKIKSLGRGKQFYISNVKAVGPDRIPRRLSPIDIILN